MLVAIYSNDGKRVIALLTVTEYLNTVPRNAITEFCGQCNLI